MSETSVLKGSTVRPVRVHLSNVTGLGAVQLVRSLLPAMEQCPGYRIERLYLPESGELADYRPAGAATGVTRVRRRLPNSLSRLVECTFGGYAYQGESPLLVLGDLPLRCGGMQTVFMQSTLLTAAGGLAASANALRYRVARQLLRSNQARVRRFVVQTAAMQSALAASHPALSERIRIVPQPVPDWLASQRGVRYGRREGFGEGLRLVYPAAEYPHKNHALLGSIGAVEASSWPVDSLLLTIPPQSHPNPALPWLRCVGRLSNAGVAEAYRAADALLFLSLTESYGFPLVEAMWVGIPVVCPDLPYARELCGEGAVYFDAHDAASLREALLRLKTQLAAGWWPDWSAQLRRLPKDWNEVARMLLEVVTAGEFRVPPNDETQ